MISLFDYYATRCFLGSFSDVRAARIATIKVIQCSMLIRDLYTLAHKLKDLFLNKTILMYIWGQSNPHKLTLIADNGVV